MFDMCSTLFISSTLVAPLSWLQFPAECRSFDTNVQLVGNKLVVMHIQS